TSVSEENPGPAFSFTNASCQYENGGPTGTLNPSTRTVSGIGIQFSTVTVCTFTNTKQPAHITVTKVVVNDNGGTASVPNYTLKVGNNVVTSGVSADAVEGTYAITESGGPSGYTASFSGDCDANGNITMKSGVSYSCTITNNDIPPSLTLSKTAINNTNGGTKVPSDFTNNVTGNAATPGSFPGSSTGTTVTLNAGNYSVSESVPGGYAASYSTDCLGSIAVGQTKTCTVTNQDQPP